MYFWSCLQNMEPFWNSSSAAQTAFSVSVGHPSLALTLL